MAEPCKCITPSYFLADDGHYYCEICGLQNSLFVRDKKKDCSACAQKDIELKRCYNAMDQAEIDYQSEVRKWKQYKEDSLKHLDQFKKDSMIFVETYEENEELKKQLAEKADKYHQLLKENVELQAENARLKKAQEREFTVSDTMVKKYFFDGKEVA